MSKHLISWLTILFILTIYAPATTSAIREYHLTIAEEEVTIRDKIANGMTINGGIPGPTLYFDEGDIARIHVKNVMSVSTSIHWHGLLVPPTMDGVPFITQTPIQPGTVFTYEFPIRQTGTYWYHSHSDLQEQQGLYGSIVIYDNKHKTGHDHVLLLSDWTTESPAAVLRTLKRGSHWYALQKGSSQSIFGAMKAGHLSDYFKRELQRMPPMDIADIAYDYFLSNGKPENTLVGNSGETARLRIINGSATTYFHLNYGGGPMTIISADGQLVEPIEKDLFLIGVAETYDVLVNIPDQGAYEFRATAHDGSGFTSTWLGTGNMKYPAKDIPKPNLYEPMNHGAMGSLLALTPAGTMGMANSAVEAGKFDAPGMSHMMHDSENGSGMDMHHHGSEHDMQLTNKAAPSGDMHKMHQHETPPATMEKEHSAPEDHMDHQQMQKTDATMHSGSMHGDNPRDDAQNQSETLQHEHDGMHHAEHSEQPSTQQTEHDQHQMAATAISPAEHVVTARPYGSNFGLLEADITSRKDLANEGGPERPTTPYAQLKSANPTVLPADAQVREVRLTLDGDMERYTWFLNNKPISETDSIRIRQNEIVRFIMINRTMMHHPMHLHGHFFRVHNGQGDNAPLKHTVDVAPMTTTVIEFYGNEVGDWFFHCHLLYHMKSGMARLVHYQEFEPASEVMAIRDKLYKNPLYFYATADLLTSMSEGELTIANNRWDFTTGWEVGWQDVDDTEWEVLATADYHLNRFTSFFAGVDFLGAGSSSKDTRGILGLKYLLPLNLESSAWLDSDGGGRFMLEKEFELTPRLALHGEVEYDTHEEWEGKVGVSYMLNQDFSLLTEWHSEYGFGVGLQFRF